SLTQSPIPRARLHVLTIQSHHYSIVFNLFLREETLPDVLLPQWCRQILNCASHCQRSEAISGRLNTRPMGIASSRRSSQRHLTDLVPTAPQWPSAILGGGFSAGRRLGRCAGS